MYNPDKSSKKMRGIDKKGRIKNPTFDNKMPSAKVKYDNPIPMSSKKTKEPGLTYSSTGNSLINVNYPKLRFKSGGKVDDLNHLK